jgi:hypothetical protein
MAVINSAVSFNVLFGTVSDNGIDPIVVPGSGPRPDGRPGCMITVRPGINLVPDELLEHHYLQTFIDAGAVTLSDVDEPRPSISKFLLEQSPAPKSIGADPAT